MKPNWKDETIWTGDNLHIMRGMNAECVDLIYLDPPFNSNQTFAAPIGSKAAGAAFKDIWTLDDIDVAWHLEIRERDEGIYSYIAAARQIHGAATMSYLIYMAIRLMEMKRVLKPTGSIYLHCDSTAGAYLKVLMDAVFGKDAFRNEIIWKRNSAHNDSKVFGKVSDTILFYSLNHGINSDAVRVPLSEEHVKKAYRHSDENGRFAPGDLSAKGLSGGGYHYEFHGHPGPWRCPEHRMLELEAEGRIWLPKKRGVPRYKRYLHESKGQVPSCLWTDIPPVQGLSKERTGYPTQKPLALLERIIKASSNPGDMVLDPFCGCATACIAASKLQRKWAGIDISDMAGTLVRKRMEAELGMLWNGVQRKDIPSRTDQAKLRRYNSPGVKRELYGDQVGFCQGCRGHFEYRNLEVDHVIPKSKGGGDNIDNLQLLCGHCNRMKGTRTQEYLIARLAERVPAPLLTSPKQAARPAALR